MTRRYQPEIRVVAIYGSNTIAIAIHEALSGADSPYTVHRIDQYPSSLESFSEVLSSLVPRPDILLSTSNGGNIALQQMIVAACIQAGVQRFMPAEYAFDSQSHIVQDRLPPHKSRAEFIDFLRHKSSSNHLGPGEDRVDGSIEWAALATGYPLLTRLGRGHLGLDMKWLSGTVYGTGDERFAASSEEFIGRAVRAVIENWSVVRGHYLGCCEIWASINDVVRELEKAQHTEWTLVHVEAEKCIEEGQKRLQGGWPDAGMFLAERSLLCDENAWSAFKDDQIMTSKLNVQRQGLHEILQGLLKEHKHQKGHCGCG